MKLLLTFFLIFILTFQHSQDQAIETSTVTSQQEQYNFYSLKQKRQKTAAWICLGGGLTLTITGLIISSNNLDEVLISSFKGEKSSGAFESGGILMIVGGVTTLASIPLFISAGKNQKKTIMSLKGESITVGNLSYKKFKHISLALTIDF